MLVRALGDVVGMDERVEIAKLKLQRRTHGVVRNDVGTSLDNRRSVFDAALVVIGEIKNKQVSEVEPPDRLSHVRNSIDYCGHQLTRPQWPKSIFLWRPVSAERCAALMTRIVSIPRASAIGDWAGFETNASAI